MNIEKELFKLQDLKYKSFTGKLIPNISIDKIIGVKTPLIRNLSKNISYEDAIKFINNLPHKYQEEYILHAILLNKYIKDLDTYLTYLDKLLPYINNWATCDVINPKIFKKDLNKSRTYIDKLLNSKHPYKIRFGIVSLLQFYLDDNFNKKDLEILSKIKSNEYYINMAIAWYYSFALIKQYDKTIYLFEEKKLDKFIHNKSLQKAIESYRIEDDKKTYLKGLKMR